MSQILRRRILSVMFTTSRHSNGGQAGEWGSGAGKGGGAGGSVREAGGSFGKMEAAREEEYFRKLQREQIQKLKRQLHEEISHDEDAVKYYQREQIQKLKGHLHEEISHHEDAIKRLQDEIARHKEKIQELATDEDNINK